MIDLCQSRRLVIAGAMSSQTGFNLDKLLGDWCSSSVKFESLRFKAEKRLRRI